MSDAFSIQSLRTTCPRMSRPRISFARSSASWALAASLIPPGLPAPAGEHLRLDDDRPAEHLGGLARLARRRREAALRHGDPDSPEEVLALVLVEVHAAREATEDAPLPGGATVRGSRRPVRAWLRCSAPSPSWSRSARSCSCRAADRRRTAPPPAVAAPPQAAELGWNERTPETGPGLVFRVHRFGVTERGWEADVEVENRYRDPLGARRGSRGGRPVVRDHALRRQASSARWSSAAATATSPASARHGPFVPELAPRLAPGASWRGKVSAPGKLAAGRYVRVAFGPLVAVGKPPNGVPARFVWITDHAYRLRS